MLTWVQGTSTLLKDRQGRTLSDHPEHMESDDPLERVPGAPPDLPAEGAAIPWSPALSEAFEFGICPTQCLR